jgi:hypothetical protein
MRYPIANTPLDDSSADVLKRKALKPLGFRAFSFSEKRHWPALFWAVRGRRAFTKKIILSWNLTFG